MKIKDLRIGPNPNPQHLQLLNSFVKLKVKNNI